MAYKGSRVCQKGAPFQASWAKNWKILLLSLLLKKGVKCCDVPDIKYTFPSYKDILLKKSPFWVFCKGVNP